MSTAAHSILSPDISACAGLPMLIEHPKTGMLLVLVPGGKFLAGDRVVIEVELPAFYIGMHAVTNRQYEVFVEESGHRVPDTEYGEPVWTNGQYPEEKGDHPVVYVSWEDAAAYCEWAGLRLPGELEWEKAACGDDGRKYPWGEEWDEQKCRNKNNKCNEETASVWSYGAGASPYGAYQMSGNVWEWCEDWYEEGAWDRYELGDMKPASSGQYRVERGGSWLSVATGLGTRAFTASFRTHLTSDFRPDRGFRCVLGLGVPGASLLRVVSRPRLEYYLPNP